MGKPMIRWAAFGLLLASGLLSGCETPPATVYVAVQDSHTGAVPMGNNAAGETCRRLNLGNGAADIYCGEWERPSARIRPGGAPDGADLGRLANGEGAGAAWRAEIDTRFACPAEQRRTTILGGVPAVVMECQYRNGGFPQIVLAASAGGRVWYADTIGAAFEVTQRSIAALAGMRADNVAAPGDTDPAMAARLAANSFKAGDAQAYQTLMREATDANRQGNTSVSEKLYRNVIALQEKVLPKVEGRDNPDLATAVMSLGLQLSNQGRFGEADGAFARAEALIGPDGGDPAAPPLGSDPTARARLFQYRAINAVNRGQPDDALALLDKAEAGYKVVAEPALNRGAGNGGLVLETLQNTAVEALFGVVDVKRNRAWTLRRLGRLTESDTEAQAAASLAISKLPVTGSHWRERETAFVFRTRGLTLAQQGQPDNAISQFDDADRDFALGYRATRPQAENKLHAAAELLHTNRPDQALARCREAVEILGRRKDGVSAGLMAPCLDAYAAGGAADQGRLAEMFEAAQQIRSSQTNQQIQQAAKRMSENARDPKAAELIRQREAADKKVDALERQRQLATQPADAASTNPAKPLDPAALAKLDHDIEEATKAAAALEETLQAASPSYNQLVPKVVTAKDLMAALHPGEAFLQTVMGDESGWTFVLRDGRIDIGKIEGGRTRVAKLVKRLRGTLEPDDQGHVRAFDMKAAYEMYQVVLGPVAPALTGASTLTIAPAGPLLSLPFAVLLTAPVKGFDYAGAPWLVKQFAIAHVPEPGNFLALRKLAGSSRATLPWFGFGAAANVTQAQAQASFPAANCGAAAQDLAGLPELTDATVELNASRNVLGAAPNTLLTGAAFTAATVEKAPLKQYKVLHFAAHGLLPTDLACQSEPAIVTSAAQGAPDASGALLTAARIERLDLDAELVILSACNSGGAGDKSSGESMSGLARSFFAANARALLISHWSLADEVPTVLVPEALSDMGKQPNLGIAGALRVAQLHWIASRKGPYAHPTFWGALAVFGDGGGTGTAKPQAAAAPAGSDALSHPG